MHDVSKIPSLKDFSKQPLTYEANNKELKDEGKVAEPKQEYHTAQQISFDDAWQLYIGDLKNSGKRILISLFEKVTPEFDGEDSFTLSVPNAVVADRLEDEKQDMLIYLRKKTGNNTLNLTIEIQQLEDTEITPYTNKEKFESLAKKNPKLMDLKNALDLEIE